MGFIKRWRELDKMTSINQISGGNMRQYKWLKGQMKPLHVKVMR